MMRATPILAGAAAIAALMALGGGGAPSRAEPSESAFRWALPEWMPAPPVPDDNPMTAAKVALGRHLFYDARLSLDRTRSCASCHIQALAFTDGQRTGTGVHGAPGTRNVPSIANSGYFPTLTWANPHFTRIELQMLAPLFGTEPLEMGSAGREDEIFARLAADPYYAEAFPAAFPDRPAPDLFTLTRALAAFVRTVVSVDSPFDHALYGRDGTAISESAKRGLALFFDHRLECYHCHSGVLFTDTVQSSVMPFPEIAWHNTGLYNIDGAGGYPAGGRGLYEFTSRAEDMGRFRTPSLRNVGVTAPYMHDGSIETLEEVIRHYAAGGRTIADGPHAGVGNDSPYLDGFMVGFYVSDADVADLVAFLESLTDETLVDDPAFSDPWPADSPASPLPLAQ
ncbi:MAG: di-heme enzyme [Rhizobiales bacterium]|nr:di-heme enzyme [Hyphomicrobiales bacterium]